MNKKIEKAINKQINAELFSSYLYMSMSSWLDRQGFKGMAHWMTLQAQEEHLHAVKLMGFVQERGGKVDFAAIDAPKMEWDSPAQVFGEAYDHECKISKWIGELMDVALEEKDHAATIFLQWFVSEQVEEEAAAMEIVDRLKLAGDRGPGMFMLDQNLGSRPAPTPPA